MLDLAEIKELIPHRPPFLWLDRVIEIDEDRLVAEKLIEPDLDVFKGHYPHYPILPGVLLCEALFQAGAILIANQLRQRDDGAVPVVVKIENARFRRQVRPGDLIRLEVDLVEELGSAWFLKGRVVLAGKTAVKLTFVCSLVPAEEGGVDP